MSANVVPERLRRCLLVHPEDANIRSTASEANVEFSPNKCRSVIFALAHRSADMSANVVPERLRRCLLVHPKIPT